MQTPNLEDFKDVVLPFAIDAPTLLCIIAQVQLATRHPKNNGPAKDLAVKACKELQESLAKEVPALSEIMEMGWNPEFDA